MICICMFSCRNARQGDAHCRRTNSIMQQDPPPSRAPREPIPWAAEPAFICAWPPQGGTSVPAPWSKPEPGHGNPTGPIPGARACHAQTGVATSGGRVSRHPGPINKYKYKYKYTYIYIYIFHCIICLSVCLFVCFFLSLFACLSVCLFTSFVMFV